MLASARVEVTPLSTRPSVSVRSLFTVLLAVIVLVTSSVASAAGRVEWKGKTFKEREDKAWRLEVAIYLPRAPDVPHVPMKFEFQPEVYYERDMVDGKEGPVDIKVPLQNRQALIESVDVGFADAGTGKTEPRTRFSFKLTRAHGYEAGEYKVTIRDARNDQTVGTPVTLIFQGENEIIDRRAMVFSGEKKKKDAPKAEEKKADEDKPASEDKAEAKPASDEPAASEAPKGEPSDEPGTIKEKPGGCGCRLSDAHDNGNAGLALSGLLIGSVLLRRRKRSVAQS